MHNSCINYNFLCHDDSNGRAQPTSHQKVEIFHWIIQTGFDSFPLKQKSDKIEQSLSTNPHPVSFLNSHRLC